MRAGRSARSATWPASALTGIKNITSGEGGAVVTSDPKVIQSVQDARLLGVQRDTEKRYQGARSWEFDVQHQGYRYHLSNLFAALGRVQLRRFEGEFKPRRIALAQKYRSAFSGTADLKLLQGDPGPIVPFMFPVRVLNGKRDGLRQFLLEREIETGIHYKPNHLLSFYGGGREALPVTERLYEELLTLPLHPGLGDEEINVVIAAVREFFSKSQTKFRISSVRSPHVSPPSPQPSPPEAGGEGVGQVARFL